MKRLFIITGATGLVGTNLVKKLLELKEKIRILVLPNEKLRSINEKQVEVVFGDVTKIDTLTPFFERNDNEEQVCIHCAGIITISNRNTDIVRNVNVNGTKNIIEMCKRHNTDKLIYVSSVHAIKEASKGEVIKEIKEFIPDEVDGLYAKTKAEATACVLDAANEGINATVVHPSGIIGPYDYNRGNFTSLIIAQAKGKLPAIVKGGYDFVDVRDVCDGIISAVSKGRSGECYILSNNYYTIKELVDTMADLNNQKKKKVILPGWFIKPLAPVAEAYYRLVKEKPLFTAYSLRVLDSNSCFSHEKATEELNYNPRPLVRTLKDTTKWLKEESII